MDKFEAAKERFAILLEEQYRRVERMKNDREAVDYSKKDKIVIGVTGGDGIGPAITKQADGTIKIDETMCNGCGLCKNYCKFNAIETVVR